jgi:hypothetical protein
MSTIAETVTCQATHVPSLRFVHRVSCILIQPGTGPPGSQRERLYWCTLMSLDYVFILRHNMAVRHGGLVSQDNLCHTIPVRKYTYMGGNKF